MCTTYLELQKARRVLASIRVLTMAVSTALKEKSSSSGCQACSIERLVSSFLLPSDVSPIDSASRKCRCQDQYRRDDACHCALDFERGHYHGTPPRSRVVLPQNTLPQQQTRKPVTSRSDTGIVQSATSRLLPQASTRPKPPEDRTPARRIGDASQNHRGPTYHL